MRILLICILTAPLWAQTTALDILRQSLLRGVTYAALPSPAVTNQIAVVTDCSDTACSSGGGSTVRLMRYNGSAWATLGDGASGSGLASTDIDTSAELAGILTDETGSAGGFVRATTSSTVGVVLRVGAGPTIGFGAVDLADGDAVTGVLPAANVDTAIARLASPSFTTPTLGTAAATAITFGADPADAGAIRCSNNAACVAAEIASPGTDMTITPNSSNQWAFSHAISAPGFINTGAGGVAGFMELTQGTATSASANSVMLLAPTSIATAYRWIMPTAVGSTGVLKGTVSGTDATLSLAAIADADVPDNITITLAATATALAANGSNCSSGQAPLGVDASGAVESCFAVSTASSSDTLTNKTLDVEGTGNTITTVNKVWLPASACQNTTASLFWDTPTSNPAVAACVTGTNTQKGVADFADSSNLSMQQTLMLPSDFTGAIDARFKWFTSATTGSVVWQIATICVADAETDDPAFNTASTVTDAAKGTTNQTNDATVTGVTATGCAAGELMHVKVSRDSAHASDDLAATARLIGVELSVRRAQ